MPRDSSGNFTREAGVLSVDDINQQEFNAGTKVNYGSHDAEHVDIKDELTDSLSRSGKGGMQADLKMSNDGGTTKHKITLLADGTGDYDALNKSQIVTNVRNWVLSPLTPSPTPFSSPIVATANPTIGSYQDGQLFYLDIGLNSTSDSLLAGVQLNINGQGARQLIWGSSFVPASGGTAVRTVRAGEINEVSQLLLMAITIQGTGYFLILSASQGLKSWTPTFAAGGSMTYTVTGGFFTASYMIDGPYCDFELKVTDGILGGTASNSITFTLPITPAVANATFATFQEDGNGTVFFGTGFISSIAGNGVVSCRKDDNSNYTPGSSGGYLEISGRYRIGAVR